MHLHLLYCLRYCMERKPIMGRMLGSFADENELDRPDLNKCPDCQCYFAGDTCPLCGKICPEEMRAGNRKAVKVKKTPNRNQYGRVTFVEWYHSWWFILLMLIFVQWLGLILLITSPHKKWIKITVTVLVIGLFILGSIGSKFLLSKFEDFFDPVNMSLSQEEYIAICQQVSPEEYYRSPDRYMGEFVTMTLTVTEKTFNGDIVCYVCTDPQNENYRIIVCDYIIEGNQNFIKGDTIVVYGEGVGSGYYTINDESEVSPAINMAYAVLVEKS